MSQLDKHEVGVPLIQAGAYNDSLHAMLMGKKYHGLREKIRAAAKEITNIFNEQSDTWKEILEHCKTPEILQCIHEPRLRDKCVRASMDGMWALDGHMLGFGPTLCYYDIEKGHLLTDLKSAIAEPMRIMLLMYTIEECNAERVIAKIRRAAHLVHGKKIPERKTKPVTATLALGTRHRKRKLITP